MYNPNGPVCFHKNNAINAEHFLHGNSKLITITSKTVSNFLQLFHEKGFEKLKLGFSDKLKWLEEHVSMT